ncbi:MAG TPA: hypothetical protein VFH92_13755 [Phenylobacterium sp.]|nr:hypothetical protein [Phenylobacterium sp.]
MRPLKLVLIAALAAQGLTPAVVTAQPSRYADRDREAVDACSSAIQGEVRARFADARGVRFYDQDLRAGPSYTETVVKGRGEFDGRDGRISSFAFGCTFNTRTGATYALDVRDVRFIEADRQEKDKDSGNGAVIAGAVIGAAILGAALASKDKHRDDWFSPADGVRCNKRERTCYRDGHYSDYWSRRIF